MPHTKFQGHPSIVPEEVVLKMFTDLDPHDLKPR